MRGGKASQRKRQIHLFSVLKVRIWPENAGAQGLCDMLSTVNDMADERPLYLDLGLA